MNNISIIAIIIIIIGLLLISTSSVSYDHYGLLFIIGIILTIAGLFLLCVSIGIKAKKFAKELINNPNIQTFIKPIYQPDTTYHIS